MPPVVLCQGLVGSLFDYASDGLNLVPGLRGGRVRYWHGIDDALRAAGYPVLAPRVHPTGGVAARARQLKAAVLRWRRELRRDDGTTPKLVFAAHSMGGLDVRHLVSRLGLAEETAAVLTVSTPHRGSAFADYTMRYVQRRVGIFGLLTKLGLDVASSRDLTMRAAQRFNDETPDAPGVTYCSVTAGVPPREMSPVLRASGRLIASAQGENDGLVAASSSEWGRVVGRWQSDHFQQINKGFPVAQRWVLTGQQWVSAVDATRRAAGL